MDLRSLRWITAYVSMMIAGIGCLIILYLVPSSQIKIIRLDQFFAFLSVIYLYLALLISPLYHSFKTIPFHKQAIEIRRTIGIASFTFALIHSLFAFFGQLNGFKGLLFLADNYVVSLAIGFVGLEILMVLAFTSFDRAVDYLSFRKWKMLHRLVYLASFLILIHTYLLGSHFLSLTNPIPIVTFLLIAILSLLEARRFDYYLEREKDLSLKVGISFLVVSAAVISYLVFTLPSKNTSSFGIHAQHILLAQQAQNNQLPSNLQGIPGFNGDPNLRYTTSFIPEDIVEPNTKTTLKFKVYNSSTGQEVKLFSYFYTKLIHLVIVDESLSYFSHIHPEQTEDGFVISTTFPKAGLYHLYTDFQPLGGVEQQMGFSLQVGDQKDVKKGIMLPDNKLTKVFGDYLVTMNFPRPLLAKKLSVGNQKITFTIKDAKTKKPITNLKPYLASFGHLTMINEATFDYVHVHPNSLTPPPSNASSGPNIEFIPLGIYGPIKPGIYRVFAQFNPNNKLITTDFTIKVN